MDQTLRTRAITAVVFAVIVFGFIYTGPKGQLALLIIIALGSSYELMKMSNTNIVINISILGIIALSYVMSFIYNILPPIKSTLTFGIPILYILLAFFALRKRRIFVKTLPFSSYLYPAAFGLVFASSLQDNPELSTKLFFAIIVLIWVNDSFAYLVGRKVGKTPLHLEISPKKTMEGFYGGGIFTVLASILLSQYLEDLAIFIWISIGLTVWIAGVVGDLLQSAHKRYYNIKDSGNIMPGHGGLYDRFDSFIFALPFVYLIIKYL